MKKTLLIDADSLIWAIAYKFSEETISPEDIWMVENKCTLELKDILMKGKCTHYAGFMAGDEPVFRNQLALTTPYKGARKEKPEWFVTLSPIIKAFLTKKYGFQTVNGIEVDDAISMIASTFVATNDQSIVISSKDKDMLQIPGEHYNYSNKTWTTVSKDEAELNIWKQVLKGDTSDSVQGIPGMGEVSASKLLAEETPDKYPYIALAAYIKKFGIRIGALKFAESCNLLIMLTGGETTFEPIPNPFEGNQDQEVMDIMTNSD